jgi:large subunit ribosomal protein L21e
MVVKSHGPRKRTREKFRKSRRTPISRFIRQFNKGDRVVIDIESSSSKGMPFRRFQGLNGKIVEKRGKAYLLEIKDGNKIKKIIANPEHLKTI